MAVQSWMQGAAHAAALLLLLLPPPKNVGREKSIVWSSHLKSQQSSVCGFVPEMLFFVGLDIAGVFWPPVGDLVKSRRAAPGAS